MPLSPPPMPPLPLPRLTLIVATTPTGGIGLNGTLPWPPLKSDLAFFARVTKRVFPPNPPQHSPPQAPPTPDAGKKSVNTHHPAHNGGEGGGTEMRRRRRRKNAVIMGRKTWDSLPERARPLPGRFNVVVSRSPGSVRGRDVMLVGTIEEGLRGLQGKYPASSLKREEGDAMETTGGEATVMMREEVGSQMQKGEGELGWELGRVFVIGGAEIYALALRMEECERVLWTRVDEGVRCDTFFPEGVLPAEGGERGVKGGKEWAVKSVEELETWVGERGVGGLGREGEREFEVCLLERGG